MGVVPIPGPSSVTAALSVAGIDSSGSVDQGFVFAGFLPSGSAERATRVQALASEGRTVVVLEAPHRIDALAAALAVLGSRQLTVGRELTKQFEEIATITCADFPAWLQADGNRSRGEFVLVLHPVQTPAEAGDELRVLKLLLAELPVKTAVKLAVEITGASRNALYEAALALRKTNDSAADGPSSHRISVAGSASVKLVAMAIELTGETTGSGPPLIVLHGLFGSATNWRSVARTLASSHEIHALDLRNHGASPWADSMGYQDMADDVRRYIESHGLGPVALMGHSMGGKTAMALALESPDLVERLIVVDIAPRSYADSASSYAQAMRSVDVFAAASRGEIQRQLQALLPDASVAPFLVQNLVTRNEHFDWRINLAAITAAMPDLTGFPAELRQKQFTGPITALAGALSDYVPRSDTSVFAPMFPDLVLEVIDGAGHWVHADQPVKFTEAVLRALGR